MKSKTLKSFWNSISRKDKVSFVMYYLSIFIMLMSVLFYFLTGKLFINILIFAMGFAMFEIYDYGIFYIKFKFLRGLK